MGLCPINGNKRLPLSLLLLLAAAAARAVLEVEPHRPLADRCPFLEPDLGAGRRQVRWRKALRSRIDGKPGGEVVIPAQSRNRGCAGTAGARKARTRKASQRLPFCEPAVERARCKPREAMTAAN